jgi:hypothetical protein
MIGPPPDPRQLFAPVGLAESPAAWLTCVIAGLLITALAAWRRPPTALRAALFILGQTVMLTTPLAAHLGDAVFGSFPTVDKEGSLLFYLDGVHVRMLLHPLQSPADPAARLIGVHVGHLWVTALFDLFTTPLGAFNAQALLYPALGWFAAWLLCRDTGGGDRSALVVSFGFGLGLHVFRDLNWYTIEKAAVFWLALYLWALHRAWGRGGAWPAWTALIFGLTAWMNLYLGLVAASLGVLAGLGALADALGARRLTPGLTRLAQASALCTLVGLPLAFWQFALFRGGPSFATPEQFLWERAALDGFTLLPLRWNRLELYRALDPITCGLGLVGLWTARRWPLGRFALLAGLLLFGISIGPVLLPGGEGGPVKNPLYFAIHAVVPGFWRMAKPEVFFEGTWLLLIAAAARELERRQPSRRALTLLYGVVVLTWLLLVRTHPAYPPMTLPLSSTLSPDWERGVFPSRPGR